MDKNDGLKIDNKNYDNFSIKSSIIKDFIESKDTSAETKSSFHPSDQISAITKLSFKTGSTLTNENFYNLNKTNRTENFRREKNKLNNTSTSFFNKTSDKLIFSSLTINEK